MKNLIVISLVAGLFLTSLFAAESGTRQGDRDYISAKVSKQSPPQLRTPYRDDVDDEIALEEDFENGAEGWTTSDLSVEVLAWHKSDFLSPEEDNLLWWCGDTLTEFEETPVGYNNSWLQFLDTPVLDLSGADEGLTLTFDAYWLLEDPRRVPPADPFDGWDGWLVMISENGGEEFVPLMPEAPEYDSQRLSAAENWWHIGPTPGWVFESGEWDPQDDETPEPDWVEVSFDLTEYAAEDIVIRFILITDRAVSAPWNPYLANSGVLIDNILLEDAEGNVFVNNNADDDPVPDELIPGSAPLPGDHWEITDASHHSGEHSMWNSDDYFALINALDTPPFVVPEDVNATFFTYWIWCDIPDWNSDDNNTADDLYQAYLSDDDGETWQYQYHDGYNNGASVGANEWEEYGPGDPPNFVPGSNQEMDLTDWAGQTIQLRIIFRTDRDHGDGDLNGEGIFIDDFRVIGQNRYPHDTGMDNMVVPYPTTVGTRLLGVTVEAHNYGTRDESSIYARWGWNSPNRNQSYPILPRFSLDEEEVSVLQLVDFGDGQNPGWTPSVPGVYPLWAVTNLGSNTPGDPTDDDQLPENDYTETPDIRVWPPKIFELGYDLRNNETNFISEVGQGPATRFSPAEVELDTYTIGAVACQFGPLDESATIMLHILGEGDETTPGEEILSMEVEVPPDSAKPNWMTIPLYENEELRNLDGDFWVWIETTEENQDPTIAGFAEQAGQNRFFVFDGDNAQAIQVNVMMHAIVVPEVILEPALTISRNLIDFGEVFIGEEGRKEIRLYSTTFAPLVISDVRTDSEYFVADFPGEMTLNFAEVATIPIYYTPQEEGLDEAQLIIEANVEDIPEIDLVGSGELDAPAEDVRIPVRFELGQAYPNPFNNITNIWFSLDFEAMAHLALYDISGRKVMNLVDSKFSAGKHSVALNGNPLAAGVYLLRLDSAGRTATQKVVLIK